MSVRRATLGAMTNVPEVPAENYAPRWDSHSRVAPPLVGDERDVLTGFLDWHRTTFELKCAGVPPERLSEKGISPSGLSLHGLVRHLAGVERRDATGTPTCCANASTAPRATDAESSVNHVERPSDRTHFRPIG